MALANYNLELNEGWQFHLGSFPLKTDMPIGMFHQTSKAGGALLELDGFEDDESWRNISVPHDWMTELKFNKNYDAAGGYKKRCVGWYKNKFTLGKEEIESATLVFDGVMGKTTVYVNGIVACRNFSGYNQFICEIGDYLLHDSENEISVFVDATRWEGWWYEGAGLYRKAYIKFRENSRFDTDKFFARGTEKDGKWKTVVDFGVLNTTDDLTVDVTLSDENGAVLSSKNISVSENSIDFDIENPKLWSCDAPYLYKVVCTLQRDDKVIDTLVSSVGLRKIEWIPDKGMYLNDEHCRVKGICIHHDHAGVGIAMPKELIEYRMSILKELGINAIRYAHSAPDETFLDICDQMGFLVMSENRMFGASDDVFYQIDAMVRVSRNHPSVFLYSLFNEEPWQSSLRGKRIAQRMKERILSLDSTRAITGAQNGGTTEKENASDVFDVIGINYFLKDYEQTHKDSPKRLIIGTENCPTYATRGVYVTDEKKQIFDCYGQKWPDYFSESLEETMSFVFSKDYVAGCFAWSGFDYRGEPTPYGWPSVVSHWGFTDYCGFKKDTAYLLSSWYKDELFAHLIPKKNLKKGENVRACVYTNGDYAELFEDNKSFGRIKVKNRRAEWDIVSGGKSLKVCVEKGKSVVYDEIKISSKAEKVVCEDFSSKDSDIHIINLYALDKNDIFVPSFCGKVTFSVEDGVILGVGNGDPNSHHNEKGNVINFFNGKAQIIVKSKKGKLTAKCENIPDVSIELRGD
ncbi:MAG: hypothetical protein J6A69_06315 [Clostridia bacterium]|nr:hypothetical protein [Clostridia bacterium]